MIQQYLLPRLTDYPFMCLPEAVGNLHDDPNHSVYRAVHSLDNFNMHVVIAGKGFVEMDDGVYTLQKGDAFLYFPMEQQRYYSSTNDPWQMRFMHFYGHRLKEYFTERGFHRATLWTLKQLKPIETAFQELQDEAENNKIVQLPRLSTLTYSVLAEFMAHAMPLTANKGQEATERLAALLPLIQQRASEPFVLEEWARTAEVSPYYFCRLFRKAAQMTPMEFVTLCRIQAAKQLLLEKPEWTVKQVALESGYQSASYFNKRFLEQEGLTPTEYRERMGRTANG
ncbi:AraC family transcriptional regulator [Paenibacillus cymbidii]|uniref:AraC family transcriptional regulator n=1 Tax=Paenibacillus cymbidii TaxID=1639034 RepID=UPI00107FEC16|nr:AraC family transcriptional regulator [Paenibacillus cymbidii]